MFKGALDGGNIWWVMPSYPLSNDVWRDLKRACESVMTDKSEIERRIELPGGGAVTVKSADRPETLVGSGLDGVVLDEAGTILEAAWKESLRPALADKQGWATFIGTPKGMNWFYDLFERAGNEDTWERWQRPTSDNPLVPPEEIAEARRDMLGLGASQELDAQFVAFGAGLFRREWFQFVDTIPIEAKRAVRYWDKAATQDGGDYSAGVLTMEHGGLFYVVDVTRGQWSSRERERVIETTARFDRDRTGKDFRFDVDFRTWFEQEPGSGGKESAENSVRRLAGYAAYSERVTGDKETRARPFAAQCEAGNVRLLRAPWNREFIDELCAFPAGAHDDQVDAASGAFAKLCRPKREFFVGVGK